MAFRSLPFASTCFSVSSERTGSCRVSEKVSQSMASPLAGLPRRMTLKWRFTRSRFSGSNVGRNTCERVRPVQKLSCDAVATEVSVNAWAPGSRDVYESGQNRSRGARLWALSPFVPRLVIRWVQAAPGKGVPSVKQLPLEEGTI